MVAIGVIIAIAIVAATAYFYFTYSNSVDKKVEPSVPPVPETPIDERQKRATTSKKKNHFVKKKKVVKPKKIFHERFVRRFGGHSEPVLDMCISPNGEWMATSGKDGQLRVTRVQQQSNVMLDLSTSVRHSKDPDQLGHLKGNLGKIAWSADNRTLVGTLVHSGEMVFYRVRKRKEENPKSPFELIELTKRRFDTNNKMQGDIHTTLVDLSHPNFLLVLTGTADPTRGNANVTVAWDATNGQSVGTGSLGNDPNTNPMRLSPDGRFLCRGGGASPQVKLFEVLKKKAKGEVEPVFDQISSKSVMTLVAGHKVADVCFDSHNMAFVGCTSGLIQLWSTDVEYRLREDPKLLASFHLDEKASEIWRLAVSATSNRIAVVTADACLHILSYTASSITPDFSIPETHEQKVADVQFCPLGDTVYTRGDYSKDVFAWNVGRQ